MLNEPCDWIDAQKHQPPPYEEVAIITEYVQIGTAIFDGDEWFYFLEDEEHIGTVKYWVRLPKEIRENA